MAEYSPKKIDDQRFFSLKTDARL